MDATQLALVCSLGTLAYLAVGVATAAVGVARVANDLGEDDLFILGLVVLGWPVAFVVAGVAGVLQGLGGTAALLARRMR